jgi:hypothetical protein
VWEWFPGRGGCRSRPHPHSALASWRSCGGRQLEASLRSAACTGRRFRFGWSRRQAALRETQEAIEKARWLDQWWMVTIDDLVFAQVTGKQLGSIGSAALGPASSAADLAYWSMFSVHWQLDSRQDRGGDANAGGCVRADRSCRLGVCRGGSRGGANGAVAPV